MPLSSAPSSTEIINAAQKRYRELSTYEFDWKSFYNGYMEAAIPLAVQRTEMLRLIDDILSTFQEGATNIITEERVEAWRELRRGWTTEKPTEDS